MRYHGNAALTLTQRRLVGTLAAQGISHSELARRFGVHRRTIGRWAGQPVAAGPLADEWSALAAALLAQK